MGGEGHTMSSCSNLEHKGRLFDVTAALTLENHIVKYQIKRHHDNITSYRVNSNHYQRGMPLEAAWKKILEC